MRRTAAALVPLLVLGAACAGEAEPPPPSHRDVPAEDLRGLTLALAELESCVHGSRGELPPRIGPDLTRKALRLGARAARMAIHACDLEPAEAAVARLRNVPGQAAAESASLGSEAVGVAAEARSSLLEVAGAVRRLAAAGDDPAAIRTAMRQGERADTAFEAAAERLEELFSRQVELEALATG